MARSTPLARARRLLEACAALVLTCLASQPSAAQPSGASESGAVASANTAGPPLAEAFEKELRRAKQAIEGKTWDEAESALTAALLLRPRSPEARYLRGEVRRVRGSAPDAITDLRAALELAEELKVDDVHAKALASLGTTLERMGELGQARDVWIRATRFADMHPAGPLTPAVAHGRIQAIDLVFEREHVYIGVRQRLADREKLKGSPGGP